MLPCMDHAFVIPAYRESPHLRACLVSLMAQTTPSHVVMSTSTPCEHQRLLAAEFGIPLHVHEPPRGIAQDWNEAVAAAPAGAEWITVAHQDDLYHADFAARTMAAVSRSRDAVVAFSSYRELDENGLRGYTTLMAIKRLLLELGFVGRNVVRGRARRRCLWFGTPIPCPAVTLNRRLGALFDPEYGVSLDWAAWLDACEHDGAFVWVREPLMTHRIHTASETTQAIAAGKRMQEDARLLRRLWPEWIARMIAQSFRIAYASNRT